MTRSASAGSPSSRTARSAVLSTVAGRWHTTRPPGGSGTARLSSRSTPSGRLRRVHRDGVVTVKDVMTATGLGSDMTTRRWINDDQRLSVTAEGRRGQGPRTWQKHGYDTFPTN